MTGSGLKTWGPASESVRMGYLIRKSASSGLIPPAIRFRSIGVLDLFDVVSARQKICREGGHLSLAGGSSWYSRSCGAPALLSWRAALSNTTSTRPSFEKSCHHVPRSSSMGIYPMARLLEFETWSWTVERPQKRLAKTHGTELPVVRRSDSARVTKQTSRGLMTRPRRAQPRSAEPAARRSWIMLG